MATRARVIVIGGGHAGVEAAWAAANRLGGAGSVVLVTLRRDTIGAMSCNPAIGGLAKGQLVREIDAMGGLMGLAADATGIQFRVLNASRGPAVRGPRCQSDRAAYARWVRAAIEARPEIRVVVGRVESVMVEHDRATGVRLVDEHGAISELRADAVVVTTGTFMRGLMHTGDRRTPGGRHGEPAVGGLSAQLESLGFELGRLKTGTPPRLDRATLDWDALEPQFGDDRPTPFSELTDREASAFPALEQVACRQTRTTPEAHDAIRANLHRAPMFSGAIESRGPRYCPSIEDKVVRFADRTSHGVFLEPESHEDRIVYCNGIATSLPEDIQDTLVRAMPGCADARIVRYGYAVEYDCVHARALRATTESKPIEGLYLAGQINGTSGYEEAAAQGLLAGINAAGRALGEVPFTLGRDQAYAGVLMDDLVTKTPTEPYRMFTSRAEHRLLLRPDNAPDRLTPLAKELGLLRTPMGQRRLRAFETRTIRVAAVSDAIDRVGGLDRRCRTPGYGWDDLRDAIGEGGEAVDATPEAYESALADRVYRPYLERQTRELRRQHETEHRRIPAWVYGADLPALRRETRETLARFRPETFGQAGRLEGLTPADLTLLRVLVTRGEPGIAHAGSETC